MVLVMGAGRLRRWTGMGGQAGATTALTGPLALRGAGCPWWGTGGVRQNPGSGDGAEGGIGAWRRSLSRQRPKGWQGRQSYRRYGLRRLCKLLPNLAKARRQARAPIVLPPGCLPHSPSFAGIST
jgi:hypothetical protein